MASAEQTGGILATLFPQYSTQITNIAKAFSPSPNIAPVAQNAPVQQQSKGISAGDMIVYGGGALLFLGAIFAITRRRRS